MLMRKMMHINSKGVKMYLKANKVHFGFTTTLHTLLPLITVLQRQLLLKFATYTFDVLVTKCFQMW